MMSRYFIKRLLLFFPNLILVSLLVFALSKMTPGDPVLRRLPEGIPGMQEGLLTDPEAYHSMAVQMGLDKPAFYFSLTSAAFPDTFHRITVRDYQHTLSRLIDQYGNWPEIQQYYHQLLQLDAAIRHTPNDLRNDDFIEVRRHCGHLFVQYDDAEISRYLGLLSSGASTDRLSAELRGAIVSLSAAYSKLKKTATPGKLYLPKIKWWGFDNQYHHWIMGFFRGNFGISYADLQPVSRKIGDALWWTLIMNLLSLFFIFLLSIPLGIYLADRKGGRADRFVSLLLFAIYSMPAFWVATLLLVFFTTPEYGHWLDWFAGPGLGELRQSAPFWDRFWERASHLVLPVFCLTYSSLAYVSRQIRSSMLEVLNMDFVKTARAKGLPVNTVLWKHAFRNALFPLISMLALIIPRLLAGSVIVEYIFAIPGMGRLMFDALMDQNWPVVYTVLLLIAILTMGANLLADICYAWADPRVKFGP